MVLAGQEKEINNLFVVLFIAIYILINRSRFITYHLKLEKNKFTIANPLRLLKLGTFLLLFSARECVYT